MISSRKMVPVCAASNRPVRSAIGLPAAEAVALPAGARFEWLDCTDAAACDRVVGRNQVDTIYHLAAILSATGERAPQKAWTVNMDGTVHILETARTHGCAVFTPSSIAAFGPSTPADPTPQDTIQRPSTLYGVTKVAGELLCDYYRRRWGLDTRGVRYPGLISYVAPPGGGTTDYAVEIFYEALEHGRIAADALARTPGWHALPVRLPALGRCGGKRTSSGQSEHAYFHGAWQHGPGRTAYPCRSQPSAAGSHGLSGAMECLPHAPRCLPGRNQRDWPVSEAGTEVSFAPAKAIAWQAKPASATAPFLQRPRATVSPG